MTVEAAALQPVKVFPEGSVVAGGTTPLQFTIYNRNRSATVDQIIMYDDVDTMLSGATFAGSFPINDVCGAGSSLSLSAPGNLTLNDGVLGGGENCTFTVDVAIPAGAAEGLYTNTTSQVVGNLGGPIGGEVATAKLQVVEDSVTFTSSITPSGPVVAGDGTEMTVTYRITNDGAAAVTPYFRVDLAAAFGAVENLAVADPLGTDGTGICDGAGGHTLAAAGNELIMAGAVFPFNGYLSVPSGAYCEFVATFNIPHGANAGLQTLTTDLMFDGASGRPPLSASASIDITAAPAVTLSKAFTSDMVGINDEVGLVFTLTKQSDGVAIDGFSFTDNIDTFHSGAVLISVDSNTCGSATVTGLETGLISVSGADFAGTTCEIATTIQVGGTPGASVENTTSELSLTPVGGTSAPVTGSEATATIDIESWRAPTFSKRFLSEEVLPGETVTMEFEIINNDATNTITDLQFTDSLSAFLSGTTASGLPLSDVCGAGSNLSALSGNTFIYFSGGTLAPDASCTFTVDVVVPLAADDGTYSNTTSELIGTIAAGLREFSSASDTLTVRTDWLEVSKYETAGNANFPSFMYFQIDVTNTHPSETITGISISDDISSSFPGALINSIDTSCGVPTVAGTSATTLSGFDLDAGDGCYFKIGIDMDGMPSGSYTNTTSQASGTIGGLGGIYGEAASATQSYVSPDGLQFSKSFDGPTFAGDTAELTFRLENAGDGPLSGLRFGDDLDAMLTGAVSTSGTQSNVCGAGSEISGTGLLSVTGISLAADEICEFSVTVSVPSDAPAGTVTNLTTSVTDNGALVAGAAEADLVIEPAPTFAKVFAVEEMEAESSTTLTFTIDNSASSQSVTGLNFTDNFPANMVVASPENASTTCTGGSVTAVAGASSVSYIGGAVWAGASCTVSVDVTVPTAGDYLNVTGDLTSSSGNSGTASAGLVVNAKPTGDVTFFVSTDEDGTYGFSSAEAALNFDIVTAAGAGQYGPVSVDYDPYTVNVSVPAGVNILDITCTDGNSTGDPETGVISLNVEADEVLSCTVTATASASRATAAINDYLQHRTALLLANQPDRNRRINRLQQGAGAERLSYVPGQLAPFNPVDFDFRSIGSGDYHVATSLDQVTRAADYMRLSTGNAGVDGSTHHTRDRFDIWFEATWTQFEGEGEADGQFGLIYLGMDHLVNDKLLVGALVQYDWLSETSVEYGSTIEGTGWMVGPYMTAEFAPGVYFDGRAAWGRSSNDIDLGIATGAFTTERWLVNASLTGEFTRGMWTIRPNAELSYIQETQQSYVDSLNQVVPEQTVSRSQIRLGPNFSTRIQGANGHIIEPFLTFDAIFNSSETTAELLGGADGPDDGWRGRVEAGVSIRNPSNGSVINFTGNLDGLGQSNYEAWGLDLYVSIPF